MKVDFKKNNEVVIYGGTRGTSIYFDKFALKNLFYQHSFKKSLKFYLNIFNRFKTLK